MTAIAPTVGRVIHFFPAPVMLGMQTQGPLAALIAKVNEDDTVNLAVFDSNGMPFHATNVRILDEGEAPREKENYAAWMPYQLGQAALTPSLLSSEQSLEDAANALDKKASRKAKPKLADSVEAALEGSEGGE